MNPKGYRWMPLKGMDGVEEKAFATFSDCKIRCSSYKLRSGAAFKASGRGIFLVLSGRGSVDGQTFRRFTSVYLDSAETIEFKASEVSELLLLGMPDVALMMQDKPAAMSSQAAE
jgi:hypothetical protein